MWWRSESQTENSNESVESIVLISDANLPIRRPIPVTVSFNCQLTFQATLFFLHDLHGDQVLEVRVMSLKSIANVFICLTNPGCYKQKVKHISLVWNNLASFYLLTDNVVIILLVVKMSAANLEHCIFLLCLNIGCIDHGRLRSCFCDWLLLLSLRLSLLAWHY